MQELNLLPGVDPDYVRARLSAAGGDEIDSGKFSSDDSSAALAVNAFAFYHGERAGILPPLPGTEDRGWPATQVDVEFCARFPWAGGRHPWLDALVVTSTHILGIESKRHEPFRDKKKVSLSAAYGRKVWGDGMGSFEAMRDLLRSGELRYEHLDATQLVKHAFGLVTESKRSQGKHPVLVYLYEEPKKHSSEAKIKLHREEIASFQKAVAGAAVSFVPVRWRDWLVLWLDSPIEAVRGHGAQVRRRFDID
ncbi:MAG TPA: hypothetical protein VEN81_03900 [Planctomycetota bacterium]|nr:hypothetical protein [Planctomycetota bacterium]